MQSSLLDNSCNDNSIQNYLFFFTFKSFVNHILRQKQFSQNTNRWVSFVKPVITFKREQFSIILMIVKQFPMNHHKIW